MEISALPITNFISHQSKISAEIKLKMKRTFADLIIHYNNGLDPYLLHKTFFYFYSNIPRGKKGRNVKLLCTTIYILLSRNTHNYLPVRNVLSYEKISLKNYSNCLKYIYPIQPKFINPGYIFQKRYIFNCITRIGSEFSLPDKVVASALKIASLKNKKLGTKPEIIACTSIFLAAKKNSEYFIISRAKIAEFLHVSVSTIYNQTNPFLQKK